MLNPQWLLNLQTAAKHFLPERETELVQRELVRGMACLPLEETASVVLDALPSSLAGVREEARVAARQLKLGWRAMLTALSSMLRSGDSALRGEAVTLLIHFPSLPRESSAWVEERVLSLATEERVRSALMLAETTARLVIDELRQLGDPLNEADAHRVVGAACAAQRRYDDALLSFSRALEIAREHGHALNEAEVLRDRVDVRVRRAERALALDDARASLAIFERLGARAECDALRERIATLA